MVSVRVPKAELPAGRTETLTSKRMLPWLISPSQILIEVTILWSFFAKAMASSALRISGSDTISIRGVPARFRSTPDIPYGRSPS